MILSILALSSCALIQNIDNREVEFTGVGGLKLAGTLTAPAAGTKLPAVVILPGSGPTDRDGNSIAINVPINLHKEMAERLAKEGIASLRFDKRAVMRYSKEWPKDIVGFNDFLGWDRFVGDATAAYRFLQKESRIDAKRVGIIGHSEGGLITLQIGSDLAKNDPPKAIVLLGTCGRKFGPVIHDQMVIRLRESGLPEDQQRSLLATSDASCEALATGKPLPPNMPKELAGLFNPYAEKLMRAYCTTDPLTLAANYPGPVLIVNGADDVQVNATKDAPLLQAEFKKRTGGSVELKIVPKASHNFKQTTEQTKDTFGGPVLTEMLDTVAGFLKKQL